MFKWPYKCDEFNGLKFNGPFKFIPNEESGAKFNETEGNPLLATTVNIKMTVAINKPRTF